MWIKNPLAEYYNVADAFMGEALDAPPVGRPVVLPNSAGHPTALISPDSSAPPAVNPRVGQLEGQVGQLHTELNHERVQRSLDADSELESRWRKLNHDQGFLAWLSKHDPLSDELRSQMLSRAYNHGDAARVK